MARTGRAVVIGASMGGLLAARVLSETFERVTVIDRDTLPEESVTRRGVPQGRQVHGLLARGFTALNELFPAYLVSSSPRLGFMLAQEGNRFGLVLAGILGEESPVDPEGYLNYARSLDAPDITEIATNARPLDDPVLMRFPANVRRRYERLHKFPDRYLPFGDALCSFKPTYGQGMTVAALEALLLRRLLADGRRRLARRFFHGAAKIIDIPWALAVGGDLRFPAVEGRRSPMNRLVNGYLAHYYVAAAHNPLLGTALLRVANLIDPPPRLFAPDLVRRVLRHRPEAHRQPALARS